jgi:hypothetical protein
MAEISAQSTRRIVSGLFSEKKSIATALMIGLLIWTLTRLADGVTGSGTIEYKTVYSPATLKDGTKGQQIEVTLTNLSKDTAINGLQATIHDPKGQTTFSDEPQDSFCIYQAPAWADDGNCAPNPISMEFETPLLVPGTYVSVAIKYTQKPGATHEPIVRIRPKGTTKFQLIEPGLQTFVARHEQTLLVGLLVIVAGLFVLSLGAGISEPPIHKEE